MALVFRIARFDAIYRIVYLSKPLPQLETEFQRCDLISKNPIWFVVAWLMQGTMQPILETGWKLKQIQCIKVYPWPNLLQCTQDTGRYLGLSSLVANLCIRSQAWDLIWCLRYRMRTAVFHRLDPPVSLFEVLGPQLQTSLFDVMQEAILCRGERIPWHFKR